MVKQKEDTEQKTDRKRQSDIERERRQGSTVGYFNNVEYLQQRQIDTRHVLYVTRGREDNARSTLISTSNIYYILGQSVMWKCVERKLEFYPSAGEKERELRVSYRGDMEGHPLTMNRRPEHGGRGGQRKERDRATARAKENQRGVCPTGVAWKAISSHRL